jgi:hypothetical protein
VFGKKEIEKKWRARFANKVHSYLIAKPLFRIDDLLRRFAIQAAKVHKIS